MSYRALQAKPDWKKSPKWDSRGAGGLGEKAGQELFVILAACLQLAIIFYTFVNLNTY